MGLAFYINKYIYFIVGVLAIIAFVFVAVFWHKYKKDSREQKEFFGNIVSCAMFDFKHKVNEHEVASKNK